LDQCHPEAAGLRAFATPEASVDEPQEGLGRVVAELDRVDGDVEASLLRGGWIARGRGRAKDVLEPATLRRDLLMVRICLVDPVEQCVNSGAEVAGRVGGEELVVQRAAFVRVEHRPGGRWIHLSHDS
jgi:hypothetical protein